MVVSEIGEIWSPQTAPAKMDATEMVKIGVISIPPNTETAIGIRMANVPQEVPVAKASPKATRKKIAGKSPVGILLDDTTLLTNAPAFK